MKCFKHLLLLPFVLLTTSCAPTSLSEYRAEGEGQIKKLLEELTHIDSISQLESKEVRLKKRFSAIADLMIAAKKFQMKHPDEAEDVTTWQIEVSEALKQELTRLYEIQGCAEKIEEIQRDSLHKLDLFKRRHLKREI